MAYAFKRKEPVSKAVQRIGCERIEHALECLEDSERGEAIHCARKDIKKVRAVLRLVRGRIAKKKFRRLTRLLREAAAQLSAPRDAEAKTQAVRKLASHFKGQLAPGALRKVREELRKAADDAMKRFAQEKTSNNVGTALRRELKGFGELKVKGRGWNSIGPGVRAAYRAGRRAFRVARNDPSPENLHEWRKRAKDLWYHARLLEPVWPEQIGAMAGELETLGELLGDDHDLAVLHKEIEDRRIPESNPQEGETICGLLEQRRRDLQRDALALGARFYAEKPRAFCDRLEGYWRIWQDGKKARLRPTSPTR
jgi:CHAD domain-containing protein